jgi:hypothetical protein
MLVLHVPSFPLNPLMFSCLFLRSHSSPSKFLERLGSVIGQSTSAAAAGQRIPDGDEEDVRESGDDDGGE